MAVEGIKKARATEEEAERIVEEASDGQIGYLHFPDPYLGSAVEFPKYFYNLC